MNDILKLNVIFADGTSCEACVSSGAVAIANRFIRTMPSMFDGTGFDPLDADLGNIVAITRADHDALHQASSVRKADFRLGQLDMKESIVNMLRDAGDVRSLELRAGLTMAAALVESMEVPHADARE